MYYVITKILQKFYQVDVYIAYFILLANQLSATGLSPARSADSVLTEPLGMKTPQK